MHFQSYFNNAVKIIQSYKGNIPLHHYLKQYFAANKKHGSKDRKVITHLCYCFYRLGKAITDCTIEERLKIAIFICNDLPGDWSFLFTVDYLENWNSDLQERLLFIENKIQTFSAKDIFPYEQHLSNTTDASKFNKSFLVQPDLFLRIRPGKHSSVIQKLKQNKISYIEINQTCLALPAATKIDVAINVDEDVVVQDLSSQKTAEFLNEVKVQTNHQSQILSVWDCCAASGGKAILAYDIFQNIALTVSDIRPSIIQNLRQRFAKAGIQQFSGFVADVTNTNKNKNEVYDLIICDAPCTGSGTWSRTPEQLYFFNQKKIDHYTSLQKKIIKNIIPSLKRNGWLLYITCSVFKDENEMIADFIKKQFHLNIIKMELLKGYERKADTMFAALFKQN